MEKTGILREKRFLDHHMGAYHPESPERLRVVYDMLDTAGFGQNIVWIPARPSEREEVLAVHDEGYLDRLAATAGKAHTFLDPDTSTCADSWDAALLAAGGLCEALSEVYKGNVNNAFALVRPPGHHAERNRSMGFCLLNNIAVAARFAQSSLGLSKILIVDWDLHHGNGTQHTFEDDPTVFYISTHQYPYYPGTGAFSERGVGAGEGYTLNIPLSTGCGDGEYAAIFEEIIRPAAMAYQPDLVLVSAGMDIHRSDPLGGMGVTPEGFCAMTRTLMEIAETCCQKRMALTLEGGYDLEGLRESIKAILEELSGQRHTEPAKVASGARLAGLEAIKERVKAVHPRA